MRVSDSLHCLDFPCADVRHEGYLVSDLTIDPSAVSMVMISEAAPQEASDGYYAGEGSLFEETTVLAFNDAGAQVSSISDILQMGVYLTTAVKCAKTGYGINAATINECSKILEQELALFPNVSVHMLMGDVAIRALNYIAKRKGQPRVIPAGSTYKIRGREYTYQGARVFPSYLQAGPSFFIEKSKRRMIAEDIAAALKLLS
jgi:uracil-DNA glycosylase